MPYYSRLISLLLAAPHRVTPDGTINLTAAEADVLRACDFRTAVAGMWYLPAFPRHAPVPDYLFRQLPQLRREISAPVPLAPPTAAVVLLSSCQPAAVISLASRVRQALAQPIPARILRSMSHRPDARSRKSDLQRRLRRIAARDLNPAIDDLIRLGLIVRDDHVLALPADVRQALATAGVGVRRAARARATARERARRSREQAKTQWWRASREQARQRRRHRPYRPRPLPDRHRRPHEWSVSMRAKKAGRAAQRLYRALGVAPTAPATAARIAKSAQREQRQAPAGVQITDAMPAAQQPATADDARSATGTTTRLALALEYNQPIGRRERLIAERNRR